MASRRLLSLFPPHRPVSLFKQLNLTPTRLSSSYKSSISIDKLYPNADVNAISKNPPAPENEPTKFSGYVPMDSISLSYSRSSGPGGQNVNKLNTKVTIRFKVSEATWIPDGIRQNFIEKFKNQITTEGEILVTSDRTRYQHLNRADAFQKLREMVRACEPVEQIINVEAEEKARKLREKAARERLITKRSRSNVKASRGAV